MKPNKISFIFKNCFNHVADRPAHLHLVCLSRPSLEPCSSQGKTPTFPLTPDQYKGTSTPTPTLNLTLNLTPTLTLPYPVKPKPGSLDFYTCHSWGDALMVAGLSVGLISCKKQSAVAESTEAASICFKISEMAPEIDCQRHRSHFVETFQGEKG